MSAERSAQYRNRRRDARSATSIQSDSISTNASTGVNTTNNVYTASDEIVYETVVGYKYPPKPLDLPKLDPVIERLISLTEPGNRIRRLWREGFRISQLEK